MKEYAPGFKLPDDIAGYALKQFCFDLPDNPAYSAAFWGHVWKLGQSHVWERLNAADTRPEQAAQYWRTILNATYERYLDNINCETDDCRSYSPGAPFIQWFPNNPYTEPGLVGAGYNNPAWYLATTASNLALGSSPGDVITSLDRFPPGSLPTVLPSSGLPRFRINVSGVGRVAIHLVNLVAGSIIQLTKDDNPLTVKFIDVDKNIVAVPPETADTFVIEVEFDTPGLHWIDCIVVSWLNTTIPFLHHGGGLRQVDLCGFTTMAVVPPMMIRSDPSGCGDLQTSVDGGTTWVHVANSDFLRRDGVCPMLGGLEIYPTANQVLLTMKGAVNPYQAAKIMVVQDGAGVDRAWINPRGDGNFSGDASNGALYLYAGGIRIDNTYGIRWKDAGGTYRDAFYGINGQLKMQTMGNGMGWFNLVGAQMMAMNETGLFAYQNTQSGGVTLFQLKAGSGNGSTSALMQLLDNSSNFLHYIRTNGQSVNNFNDAATNTIADELIVEHASSATPGAGFGVGVKYQGKSSTTASQAMARLYAAWETPTHATRAAKVVLSAFDFSGEKTLIEGGVTGASTPKLGVLGAPPQPRLVVSGDWQGNVAGKHLAEAMALFGWITDTTSLGEVPSDEPFAVIGDRQGNEALAYLLAAGETADLWVDNTTNLDYPPAPPGGDIRCEVAGVAGWIAQKWYARAVDELYINNILSPLGMLDVMLNKVFTGIELDYDPLIFGDDNFKDWGLSLWWAANQAGTAPDYEEFLDNNIADVSAYFNDTVSQVIYNALPESGILTVGVWDVILGELFAEEYDTLGAGEPINIDLKVPTDIPTWCYHFLRCFSAEDITIAIAAARQSGYVGFGNCVTYGEVWCKTYDLSSSGGRAGWTLEQGTVSGGYENLDAGHIVFFHRDELESMTISRVVIDAVGLGSDPGSMGILWGAYDFTDSSEGDLSFSGLGSFQYDETFEPPINVLGFRVVGTSGSPAGNTIRVTGVTIYGVGEPFASGGEVCL